MLISYLRNKNRIRPAILHWHIFRRAVHYSDALQLPLSQHPPHISVRLDGKNLKAFLTSRQSFGEDSRAGGEVDDASSAFASYAALREEVLKRS